MIHRAGETCQQRHDLTHIRVHRDGVPAYIRRHARPRGQQCLRRTQHRPALGSKGADATTAEPLGHITLIGRDGELTDTAALGYWAHPAARGAGITTAAAGAVVNEALTPAADGGGGLRRLTLRVTVGNVASQRVAEAAGFMRTGRTRQSDPLIDGTFTDEFTYDLLATDPR